MTVDQTSSRTPSLGRGLAILVGLAAALVAALALRAFAAVLAPVFLAVVLSVTVQPIRRWPWVRSLPSWVGTVMSLLTVYGLVALLVVVLGVAGGQLGTILESYKPQLESEIAHAANQLREVGFTTSQVDTATRAVDPGQLIKLAGTLIGGVAGLLSSAFFVIALLFFTITDAGEFTDKLIRISPGGERLSDGFRRFARGTRQYLLVSTVFGFAVAAADLIALTVLGIRYAWLWSLLAFITNYIPNIGFLIGLAPPTLLALLDQGPRTAVVLVVIYCLLNVVIQTVIQPRVVGTAVGLSATLSFLSLIIWTTIFGGIGALLAVPLSLFVKAQLVDVDPDRGWLSPLLSSEGTQRARRDGPGSRGQENGTSTTHRADLGDAPSERTP